MVQPASVRETPSDWRGFDTSPAGFLSCPASRETGFSLLPPNKNVFPGGAQLLRRNLSMIGQKQIFFFYARTWYFLTINNHGNHNRLWKIVVSSFISKIQEFCAVTMTVMMACGASEFGGKVPSTRWQSRQKSMAAGH